jgi:uncharacterized protein YaaQ
MSDPNKANQTEKFLLVAIVQAQDVDNAANALEKLKVSVTRLPSVGGFLGRRNATLMIGLEKGQEKSVMDVLHRNCRQRIEYIAVPLESAPLPLPAPTPITIGGLTGFFIPVEHFEEL